MASLEEVLRGSGTQKQYNTQMQNTQGVSIVNIPNVAKTSDMTQDVEKLMTSVENFAKVKYKLSEDAMQTVATDHLVQYEVYKNEVLSDQTMNPRDKNKLILQKVTELNDSVKEQLDGDEISSRVYNETFYNKAKIDYAQTGYKLEKEAYDDDLKIQDNTFKDAVRTTPYLTKSSLLKLQDNNIKEGKYAVSDVEAYIIDNKVNVMSEMYDMDRASIYKNGILNAANIEKYIGDYVTVKDNQIEFKKGISGYEQMKIMALYGDIQSKESTKMASERTLIQTNYKEAITNEIITLKSNGDISGLKALKEKVISYLDNTTGVTAITINQMVDAINTDIKNLKPGSDGTLTMKKSFTRTQTKEADTPQTILAKVNEFSTLDEATFIAKYPDKAYDYVNTQSEYQGFREDLSSGNIHTSTNPTSILYSKSIMREAEGKLKNIIKKKELTSNDAKLFNSYIGTILETGKTSDYVSGLISTMTTSQKTYSSLNEVRASVLLSRNGELLKGLEEKDKRLMTGTGISSKINQILESKENMSDDERLRRINITKNSIASTKTLVSNQQVSDFTNIWKADRGQFFTFFDADISETTAKHIVMNGITDGALTVDSSPEEMAKYANAQLQTFDASDQKLSLGMVFESIPFVSNNATIPARFKGSKFSSSQIKKAFKNLLDVNNVTLSDIKADTVFVNGEASVIVTKKGKDGGANRQIGILNAQSMPKYFYIKRGK